MPQIVKNQFYEKGDSNSTKRNTDNAKEAFYSTGGSSRAFQTLGDSKENPKNYLWGGLHYGRQLLELRSNWELKGRRNSFDGS